MAYRHSLNKNNTKTATLAPHPIADQAAKFCWLATTLDDGLLIELHQNSVFNDTVVEKTDCGSVYAWMVLLALKAM